MGFPGKISALAVVSSLVIGPVVFGKPVKGNEDLAPLGQEVDLPRKSEMSQLQPPTAPRSETDEENEPNDEGGSTPPEVDDEAERLLNSSLRLEKLKSDFQKSPKDRLKLMRLAEELIKQNDAAAATKLLWSKIELLDRAGFLMLARTHEKRAESSEMLRAVNLLLAKDEKDEEALVLQGNAILLRPGAGDKGGKVTEAKEAYKKALEANPKYQPAYAALAKIYQKNPYELRILYQDMITTFGAKSEFLAKLCEISTNDGDNEEGEKYCNQGIAKDSKVPENYVHLGIIAKQKGDQEKAKKLLKEAAAKFPKSEFAQYETANFLMNRKDDLEAYNYFQRCLRADARSERCLIGLGLSGVQIQKHEQAYNSMKQACHIGGRKHAAMVRRAASVLRSQKALQWSTRFEDLASGCSSQ